jgi:copper chaperone NosL
MTRRLLLLAAVLAAGCSAKADGPPDIQVDRTACAHCTMLVSDERFAAAYETPSGEARVFDDIGCMREALKSDASAASARLWYHDVKTGEWIRGEEAAFETSPRFKTPMGSGIVAYRKGTPR